MHIGLPAGLHSSCIARCCCWPLPPPSCGFSDRCSMENGAAHPILTVFSALSLSIGLPFLVLSATSPLLQVWWARVESGKIPYRLYALSNVGSLLALASVSERDRTPLHAPCSTHGLVLRVRSLRGPLHSPCGQDALQHGCACPGHRRRGPLPAPPPRAETNFSGFCSPWARRCS